MKCERCDGQIVSVPILKIGKRKPALSHKRVCKNCGFWPSAYVSHGSPNEVKNANTYRCFEANR